MRFDPKPLMGPSGAAAGPPPPAIDLTPRFQKAVSGSSTAKSGGHVSLVLSPASTDNHATRIARRSVNDTNGWVFFRSIQGEGRRWTCSCRRLQLHAVPKQRTGSVFGVSAYFPANKVQTVSSSFRTFVRSGDLGTKYSLHFCPTCGSTVYWEGTLLPGLRGVGWAVFPIPHSLHLSRPFSLRTDTAYMSLTGSGRVDGGNHINGC